MICRNMNLQQDGIQTQKYCTLCCMAIFRQTTGYGCMGIDQNGRRGERMNIMLGNLSPEQIERRLKIELSDVHRQELKDAWQQKAEDIADDKWHCFDIPFMMVCGNKSTAERFRDLFLTYDLSKGEMFQISWKR